MSDLALFGAGCFGAIVGWYVYYINRYRKAEVSFNDLVTVLGIIGGAAVQKLFSFGEGPAAGSAMFGAYGVGLAVGFFGYFVVLVVLVGVSKNFDADWFLDGRRKDPVKGTSIPDHAAQTGHSMGGNSDGGGGDVDD